jgi:tRNA pseudouridine55 synthase
MSRNNSNVDILTECGVLLVDKPRDVTSHDVVSRVRRHCGTRKVGHGGTLDPFATGLLLLLMGRATRLFDLFLPLVKEYRATVQFGYRSTTGDSEGEITEADGRISESALTEALTFFRGAIRQKVPAYSAVKVDGERLYQKARRGEEIDTPERKVEIHELELLDFDDAAQKAVLRVICSKGTYIRSLCEDIAAKAGAGAYTAELRRVAVGELHVDKAVGLEQLEVMKPPALLSARENPSFFSCFSALYFLPVRKIGDNEVNAVTNGRPLAGEAVGPVRVASDEKLLAVYGPGKEKEFMYPMVVFS